MKPDQPTNVLGNPVEYADIAIKQAPDGQVKPNPIMAGGPPAAAAPATAEGDKKLDKDLKEVSKEVKASDKKPKKDKSPGSKPVMVIILAIIAAIALSAAAYLAFKKSN